MAHGEGCRDRVLPRHLARAPHRVVAGMTGRPTWEPMFLRCKSCRHEWDDWTPQNAPAKTIIAHWKTYRCPACGKAGGFVLLRFVNAEPET